MVVISLLTISVGMWWHVWVTGHPTTTITCQCGDPSQELWFLTWTPWALVHGHNPLLSNAIYAGRGGANMLVNTGIMLPATVLAPITWLFGPIAAFNVATLLAPVLSGWVFFLALRRVSTFFPGQLLGSLLYGFSPFMIWNEPYGHLNLTLLYFPPLALLLLYDLTVTRRRSPRRNGLLLGLLVVAQFFTGTEVLAMSVTVAAVGLGIAALMASRAAWSLRCDVLVAFGVAALVAAIALGYPLWFLVSGPRHIVGAAWQGSSTFGAPPGALVQAGTGVHRVTLGNIVGGSFNAIGPNFSVADAPNFDYLGLALVALLGVSAVTWARSRLAWTLVGAGGFAWVCSLGNMLGSEFGTRSQRTHPWWLPWHLLGSLPLLDSVFPIRFGAIVTFSAAALLVLSLDRWWHVIKRGTRWTTTGANPGSAGRPQPWKRRRSAVALCLAVGLVTVGAVTLLPVVATYPWPFTTRSSSPPRWFFTAATRLPRGTVAMVLPFGDQTTMGWQAEARIPVSLAGGFALVPGPTSEHTGLFAPPAAILESLAPSVPGYFVPPPPPTGRQLRLVAAALVQWQVDVVVIPKDMPHSSTGLRFFTRLFARRPRAQDGSWVWSGYADGKWFRHPNRSLMSCEWRRARCGAP